MKVVPQSINSSLLSPIAVLGTGSWGTALAIVLANNGSPVKLWGFSPEQVDNIRKSRCNERYLPGSKLPENIDVDSNLANSVSGVRDLVFAIPSYAFRNTLEQIHTFARDDIRIAWGTKGLDPGTRMLLHQVVAEVFSKTTPAAVLSGPSFATELAAQKPTAVSLAGNNDEFIDELIKRFHNAYFRIYKNPDFIGVQICGTVKNVIAIGVGVCDGLQLGANTRSALITRGLVEMSRLVLALGGRAETIMSLAGVGDLVLTCTDNQSRNRRLGLAIAQKQDVQRALKEIGQSVEGLNNTREVYELSQSLGVEMPIIEQVYKILHHHLPPEEAVAALLTRAPASE